MLDADAISAMPVTDEQKRTLLLGDVAEQLKRSSAWRLLLDWGEARCNARLAAMRKAQWAAPDVQAALTKRWNADESFLQDLQIFVEGLIADRDSLIDVYSRAVCDVKVHEGAGYSEPTSFPNQGENKGDA